ncbi:MAG: CtsR family transcriptional regulator [Clostridia bacterium]|nr:CtsR family transcriptional regulator [Clostridia bacterium]
MKMSDLVAQYISRMLDESDGNAEIQRNELASLLGCVPSQINYVITSRFTPEQGYIVESRRGGGGYIRITRVTTDRRVAIMHIVNSVGDKISSAAAQTILSNMAAQNMISQYDHALISSALSDKAYSCIQQLQRDQLRAAVMKNMLMTLIVLDR